MGVQAKDRLSFHKAASRLNVDLQTLIHALIVTHWNALIWHMDGASVATIAGGIVATFD